MNKHQTLLISARFIFMIIISFWIGSMFFFSTITARTIFSTLSPDEAGRVITVFFDHYYPLQYIFGIILVAVCSLLLIMERFSSKSPWLKRLVIIICMLSITLISGTVIRKSAQNAKATMKNSDQSSLIFTEAKQNFRSAHRNTVIANGLVFLLGIVILFHVSYKNKL